MSFRLSHKWRRLVPKVVLLVPGLVAAYLLHSTWWLIATPLGLIILIVVVAALPIKRKVTPQEWADELEKHLLGTEGPYGWDDATSVRLADERLENLRSRLMPDFDLLNTPQKREEFHQIIETLRRGEIP